MRITLLLLVALTASAQSPATPQNLRLASTAIDDGIVPVPVIATNGRFIASWYSPPYIFRTNSNIFAQPLATKWIPEKSIDGINWIGNQSEFILLPPRDIRALAQPCYTCLHSIEVSSATDQVRIRREAY